MCGSHLEGAFNDGGEAMLLECETSHHIVSVARKLGEVNSGGPLPLPTPVLFSLDPSPRQGAAFFLRELASFLG